MHTLNEADQARAMIRQGLKRYGLTAKQTDKCTEIFMRKETHIVAHNDPSVYELKGGF